jgi:hypothetical protein
MGNLRVHVLYKDFYYRTYRNSIPIDVKSSSHRNSETDPEFISGQGSA